jgi:hypothetical protein
MSPRGTYRTRSVLLAAATVMASCSKEPEYTDRQRACIAERYLKYDATKFDQCVDVCQQCLAGTVTTCTTSCKLKRAN